MSKILFIWTRNPLTFVRNKSLTILRLSKRGGVKHTFKVQSAYFKEFQRNIFYSNPLSNMIFHNMIFHSMIFSACTSSLIKTLHNMILSCYDFRLTWFFSCHIYHVRQGIAVVRWWHTFDTIYQRPFLIPWQ